MKPFKFRSALVIAVMAILSACGGTATEAASTPPAAEAARISANAPVADCEAEGCNRPRIIDGLAEQYRASAARQPSPAAEAVQAAVLPAAPASEAAPAVLVPPQAPVLN